MLAAVAAVQQLLLLLLQLQEGIFFLNALLLQVVADRARQAALALGVRMHLLSQLVVSYINLVLMHEHFLLMLLQLQLLLFLLHLLQFLLLLQLLLLELLLLEQEMLLQHVLGGYGIGVSKIVSLGIDNVNEYARNVGQIGICVRVPRFRSTKQLGGIESAKRKESERYDYQLRYKLGAV